MAVYTKISKKDISIINDNFEFEKITSFHGIKKGIENTNYLIKSKNKKYILTIFEKRVSKTEIPFFMKLMDVLNNSKINCPKPLKTKHKSYLFQLKKKSACIVTFLEGRDKKILNSSDCYSIGKTIARMHLVTKKIKFKRKNSMGIKKLNPLLKNIKFKSKQYSNLKIFLRRNLNDIKKNWPKNLPEGIIHADLFVDNVLFKDNKISGIIDFYFACNDFIAYELALTANDWCFNKDGIFNVDNFNSLIMGYNNISSLNYEEKASMNVLFRGAAVRILVTRLYDKIFHPNEGLNELKDPKEYIKILKWHQENKDLNL